MGRAKIRRDKNRLGNPHRRYRAPYLAKKVHALLLELRKRCSATGDKTFREISAIYNVPRTTIMRWYRRVTEDPEWTPAATHWGEHRRIFDDATEAAIAGYIRSNFTSRNRIFSCEDFHALAFRQYREVYWDAESAPRFCCSRTFIHGFMVRNRFSIRREHVKRRPPITEEEAQQWTQRLRHLLETENQDLILNCDETAWRVYPGNILTWWDTGADDVAIHVDGDEKSVITVLATISASHKKWPLFFVAKGKTERVERSQVGEIGIHWRSHSESGWMRQEIFAQYLHHLRQQVPDGEKIFLICDVHASHRTDAVKQLASGLNIDLLYIPPGATDRLQPLDRMVFGALKSEARRLFRRNAASNPELKRRKRDAVKDLIEAWAGLNDATLSAAWALYQGDENWDE
jgi:hypothetical protein